MKYFSPILITLIGLFILITSIYLYEGTIDMARWGDDTKTIMGGGFILLILIVFIINYFDNKPKIK